MSWVFYKMEGCSGQSLRPTSDPRVSAYLTKHGNGQTLYIPAVGWAPNTEADWVENRRWSMSGFLIRTMGNRLLTVRTEWSRK